MPKLQLSFHTTFALKKDDIERILQVAQDENGLNSPNSELISRTGLGNKKIGPMKSWTYRGGLINEYCLSSVGKIVWTHDRFLESPITDWLLHFFLSFGEYGLKSPPGDPAEWGGWTYFVYSFLPEHPIFSLDELVYYSSQVFVDERQDRLNDNFWIVLRAYTEKKSLANCGFLQKVDTDRYQVGLASPPPPYLTAFFLAKLWERDFSDTDSVVTEKLVNHPMGLTKLLGLTSELIQIELNKLQAYGIIEQRRTVPPFQVVRRWGDALELLRKAYTQ